MPYTHLDLESHDWPFPNRYFDPAKASALYKTYVESMIHAEGCGFDWVGCNEHHFSPYGMMANCNLIGGPLAYPTKRVKIAMSGNLVPRAPVPAPGKASAGIEARGTGGREPQDAPVLRHHARHGRGAPRAAAFDRQAHAHPARHRRPDDPEGK